MAEKKDACPICKSFAQKNENRLNMTIYVDCERCGKFILSDEAKYIYDQNKTIDRMPIISYWIRKHQNSKPIQILSKDIASIISTTKLPNVKEQADNLLLWFGSNAKSPDHLLSEKINILSAIVGAKQAQTVKYLASSLTEKGLMECMIDSGDRIDASLTFDGWEYYEKLLMTNNESRLVFMAMQYDNEILQKIFKDVIMKAVHDTGFEIRKLDDVKRAGLIDDKLRVEIRRSKFLIADLTDENRGAYWEAGFAEGLGMNVIYICEEKKFDDKTNPIHFDTNHHLTVKWYGDQDRWEEFARELKATIRATFPAEAKFED